MRIGIALACAALVVGACGSNDEPSDDATTAPPPRAYTIEELTAALPDVESLDNGEAELAGQCPSEEKDSVCGPDTASLTLNLESTRAAADVEADAAAYDYVPRDVYIAAEIHPSEEEAANQESNLSVTDAELGDSIDTKAEETEQGFIPGIRGTGQREDFEKSGWAGDRRVLDIVFVDPESEAFTPEFTHVEYTLSSGKASIRISVAAPNNDGGLERAQAVADQALDHLLTTLPG